jgi:hypothetical protein
LAIFHIDISLAQTFTCPEKIETPPVLIENHPGWKSFANPQPQYFDQISLTSGLPDQNATLVPDIDSPRRIEWSLSPGEEYWLVCNYLASNVSLARRLPVNVQRCFVKRKRIGTKATQEDPDLICK